MIDFIIKKASKRNKKLRISLSAPSGAGKTVAALKLAYGICGDWSKIYMIDTERESGSLYADMGDFNILNLRAPYSPQRYIKAIQNCEQAGAEVVIIDSITMEWSGSGGCLEIQQAAGSDYKAWGIVTPMHNAFIDAILSSKAHVLCTVRRKEDYALEPDATGKLRVKKLGLGEEQRSGFNYEMDVVFEIDQATHLATISKDRTNAIKEPEFFITETTGETLMNWAKSGASNNLDEALEYLRKADCKEDVNLIVNEYKELHADTDFRDSVTKKRELYK